MRNSFRLLVVSVLMAALAGCATMGAPFDFQGPDTIVAGKTTKQDIIKRYGQPFRVGYENGNVKWTYGYYQYRLFGDSQTSDLSITFNKNGLVSEYTYSTSDPAEVRHGVRQQ